jgi:hypothetical protein
MQVSALVRAFAPVNERVQKNEAKDAATLDLKRQARELMSRLTGLYNDIGRVSARPTADQMSRLKFYREMVSTISGR